MSSLFLAADAEVLADQLAHEIRVRQSPAAFLVPQTIVVPSRIVEQWLKLHLARKLEVAINLRFRFLEQAVWDGLVAIDPRPHAVPPELLDDATYRLLVLSTLLDGDDPELRPLQDFCERNVDCPPVEAVSFLSRLGSRRACDLAMRLGNLIRDYEYHRQESIIVPWLHDQLVFGSQLGWGDREKAQRAVFRGITAEPDGRRAKLNRGAGRNLKTLPQYVAEMLHDVRDYRKPPRRCLHLFGLTQMSPLHLRALDVLSPFFDMRVYHVNPLVGRLTEKIDRTTLTNLATAYRGNDRPDAQPGTELLHIWGRAGAESLGLVVDLLHKPSFRGYRLSRKQRSRRTGLPTRLSQDRAESRTTASNTEETGRETRPTTTVLARLQDQLLGRVDGESKLPQDRSLEIVGCPGVWREVETVHASIVDQLHRDPELRQTDIAVFVADMDPYRPALTSVFERPPKILAYNLGDYSADRLSVMGQGLLDILDLALDSFTRSRVFDVLLNPCFLARLGVRRSDAAHWLDWADELGIRHGWDGLEKQAQGLYKSEHYSWKLGLQRLRLGRYMRVADDDVPAAPWRSVIPFADVESADRDKLDAFCRAVEGLLPLLSRLRHHRGSAREWADRVRLLMHRFLDVPEDRPAEESVRESIFAALDRFQLWDELHDRANVPLPLVREFLAGQIRELSGRHSDLLAGGVTIASLRPQRAIPFQLVYLLGMGADHFPGSPNLSPLDLRSAERQPGDILPVEHQRFALLETILATRRKLVISYNERDLQKDQERQPAVPVLQLKRHLEKHVIADGPFRVASAPLLAHDATYLDEPEPWQDVLVQVRASDRLLALEDAERKKRLVPRDLHDRCEIEEQHRALARTFHVEGAALDASRTRTVPLRHLQEFLENPAAAALKRHLRFDPDEAEDRPDHEPFVTPQRFASKLMRQLQEELVRRSEKEPIAALLRDWPDVFHTRYREWMLCSRMPEHAFADVDENVLLDELTVRIEGAGGLAKFLERQAAKQAIGPILIGESSTPIGARRQFPAFEVGGVRVVGEMRFAWQTEAGLELLVSYGNEIDKYGRFDRNLLMPMLGLATLVAIDPSLDRSRFTLHVARKDGIDTFDVGGSILHPAPARAYLDRLVRDYLDPACADLLPFAVVRGDWELRKSFREEDYANPEFDRLLRDVVARESEYRNRDVAELGEAGFRVAEDGLRKIRERIGPLQRLLEAPVLKIHQEEDIDFDEEAYE